MAELPNYPENRLDVHIDEQGNMIFHQNPIFAKYYAPSRDEKEEELEELKNRLSLLELDEPYDIYSINHEEWEDEKRRLEKSIEDLEAEIDEIE